MFMSALEKLEDGGAAPQNVDDLDEVMLAVMEADKEIEEEADALEEMDETVEEAEEALERLEGIKAAIEEFGISKPMMVAADPKGELVAAGLIASYEDLDTVPVKDDAASAAIESIGKTIADVWKKLVAFFKGIWAKIKSFFEAVMRGFRTQETVVVSLIKAIKETDINESKFKEVEVSAIPMARFATIVKGVEAGMKKLQPAADAAKALIDGMDNDTPDQAADKMKKLQSAIKDGGKAFNAIGITYKVDKDDNIEVTTKSIKLERKKGTLAKLGYTSVSQIEDGLKGAYAIIAASKVADKAAQLIHRILGEFSKKLEKEIRHVADMSPEDVRKSQKVVNQSKDALNTVRQLAQHTLSSGSAVATSMISVGKGALKATGDKK